MLRWVSFAIGLVLLTAGATLLPQFLPDPEATAKISVNTVTGPQPRVEIDQPLIYEFGKLAQHEKGKHTWRITNTGEKELELWMDGKPTCSCTIAKLENNQKATVKPGESTTIDLEWNTKEFHDEYSQGATFGTNAPSLDSFKLAVKGLVYPPIVVFPPEMMQFPTISNEEPRRARIAVYSQDRPATKVTKVRTSRPAQIVAEARPMTPEENKQLKIEAGYQVTVEIRPGMPVGQFHEELIVETDHPKRSQVQVSVGGNVIGPISVVPPGLRMHDVTTQGSSRDLTVMVRGGKETHFEVASAPEKLKVAVVPDETPGMKGRYRLKITVPPGTPSGKIEGIIILKTDHPMVSELKVPVDIFVLRPGSE
ncbi:MAG: DUF1573 domain-containing protein [Isosphaeraceae bacterium]